MRLVAVAMVVGLLSIVACASRVPTASVEEHRRLAQAAEEIGIAHAALYDPTRIVPTIPCLALCFNPWTNPTQMHQREAKRSWRAAEQHQRASRKLRVAEARACFGVPEQERDITGFVNCSNITAIQWPRQDADPFIVEFSIPDDRVEEFRAKVACHVARNESRGREFPKTDDCSSIIHEADAEVVEIDELGFRVEMHGTDERTRAELRDRLTAIVGTGHGSRRQDQQPTQRQ
jgi:hypothetical protein